MTGTEIATAAGGAAATVLAYLGGRSKNNADAADKLAEASQKVIDQLTAQVDRLADDVIQLRADLAAVTARADSAAAEVRRLKERLRVAGIDDTGEHPVV